jgi:hypothetical protein
VLAEQGARNGVGGQECAEAEQIVGCGGGANPLKGDLPGGGDRLFGGERLTKCQQCRAMLLVEREIVSRGGLRLVQVGGGLLQGKRQVAQRLGQCRQGCGVGASDAAAQERHRLIAVQHIQPDRVGQSAPGWRSGGYQDPSAAGGWPVGLKIPRPLGVVVDQQPPIPLPQNIPQARQQFRLVALLGHPQPPGKPSQEPRDSNGLLGRHPPDHVVVGGIAVRVLQRQLGLADPT